MTALQRFAAATWPPLRHALYWTHRWLGIVGCLLFVMWFFSGVVMMYVAFPTLTDKERLAGAAPLQVAEAIVPPAALQALLPDGVRDVAPQRVRLDALAAGVQAGPVWRVVDATGRRHAFSARDGRALGPVDAAQATAIGRAFARAPGARWAETLERDQWTVPQGLDPLRPLHRIDVGDAAGTELYVSSVTGEVVRDTTRHERFWNWLGSVPHWIYFTPIRQDNAVWRQVVMWVSGVCFVSAITGMVIGVLRIRVGGREQRYKGGRYTPYRGWFAWHHVVGLVGGVFVVTWMASGWLSVNPNQWFERARTAPPELAWTGLAAVPWPPQQVPADARELQLLAFDGRTLLRWQDARGRTTVADAATGASVAADRAAVTRLARKLKPGAPVQDVVWLTEPDAYWYGHHGTRTLPVWRVVLGDEASTWLYVDPASGQMLGLSDETSRLRRWLFNAPHSFDFPWLIAHRPAWDVLVIALSIAGGVVSVSGVVIGWRRLRRQRAQSKAHRRPRPGLADVTARLPTSSH